MAKFFPEEIPLEELNSFTDSEFYYHGAELEDTTITDYEQPYEYLNEKKTIILKK